MSDICCFLAISRAKVLEAVSNQARALRFAAEDRAGIVKTPYHSLSKGFNDMNATQSVAAAQLFYPVLEPNISRRMAK